MERYRSPLRARVLGGLALLVVTGLLGTSCGGEEPAAYDADLRAELVDACVAGIGGERPEGVCGCWYDLLVERVPIDELPPVDDLVGDPPGDDPDDPRETPLALLADCVVSLRAVPTMPATTAPPPTTPRPPAPPSTVAPTTAVP